MEDSPPPIDSSVDPKSYHCAGLATRTYESEMFREAAEQFADKLGYERDCESFWSSSLCETRDNGGPPEIC